MSAPTAVVFDLFTDAATLAQSIRIPETDEMVP
jgi:hypothetical protein